MKKTILFLSGGSLVALGLLQILEGRRSDLRIVATNSVAEDVGLWDYDRVVLVPATFADPAAYRAKVLQIVRDEGVDLIVPCRDDDIVALAEMAEVHAEIRNISIVGSSSVAKPIADKWLSYEFSREHDLPFADSFIAGVGSPQEFARRVEYPILAKPRDGFSSQGVLLIENEAQFERALQRPNYVFEEYLDKPENYWAFKQTIERDGMPLFYLLQGLKHSMQLLFSPDSELLSGYSTYNQQFMNSRKLTMNHDTQTQAVLERCAAVFAKLKWRGPMNIQCQMDKNGQLKIHEFNGRFSGPQPERWLMGKDDVALAIEAFTGLRIAKSSWTDEPSPFALARIKARGIPMSNASALAAESRWSRSHDET
jgi:hypothetical protein